MATCRTVGKAPADATWETDPSKPTRRSNILFIKSDVLLDPLAVTGQCICWVGIAQSDSNVFIAKEDGAVNCDGADLRGRRDW